MKLLDWINLQLAFKITSYWTLYSEDVEKLSWFQKICMIAYTEAEWATKSNDDIKFYLRELIPLYIKNIKYFFIKYLFTHKSKLEVKCLFDLCVERDRDTWKRK